VEFRREAGEGDAPQRWIDGNLPVCPLCRSPSSWGTATGVEEQALVRWYFQCSNCKAIMSVIPDKPVGGFAGGSSFAKAAVTMDVRIEGVERKEDEDFVGEEFPLYELQEWAEEDQS
jgi:hypothetical protein